MHAVTIRRGLHRAQEGEDDGGRLPGSGVVLVNPPYGIDAQLEELLSSLGELLSDGAATSSHRVSWVKR